MTSWVAHLLLLLLLTPIDMMSMTPLLYFFFAYVQSEGQLLAYPFLGI